MQTMVRDFSYDQKETIKSFFTDSEWDTIYSAIREFRDHDDQQDSAYAVENKIYELFKSEVQFQEYGEGGVLWSPFHFHHSTKKLWNHFSLSKNGI